MPRFILTVATSADGFISPTTDTPTHAWASAEEQALFFRDVEAADWTIMGRNTHMAANKPNRRRIVFSSRGGGWRRPTQLWLSPKGLTSADLAERVHSVFPMKNGLILGGTRVHDWFLEHGAIDRVNLTIEPVQFGGGLPVFTGSKGEAPQQMFDKRGFRLMSERRLNDAGTLYREYVR